MKLVFKNSNNKKQDIADVKNEEQAIYEIKKFCCNKNFNISYIAVTYHPNVIIYDIGNNMKLFYLYLKSDDEY